MGATLLVVDDEQPVRTLLAAVFEDSGYRVLQASNGREALAVLEHEAVDLVLTDVMMPVMDGYELCRLLKARSAVHALPVLLMSAAPLRDADAVGTDATIAKPFDLDDVEALVRQWLPPSAAAPAG